MVGHGNPKALSTNTLTTVVGSTAAIVGLGAAALSVAAAPVAAAALAGVGTAVAAGALYKKLTGLHAQPEQATEDSQSRTAE
jgi:hypothetical protein